MVRSKEYRMSIDFHPCFVPFSLSLSLYLSIYLSLSHSLHDCPITGRENISSKPSFVLGWAGKFLRYGFLCGARVFRQLRVSRKKKLLDL